MEMTTWKPILNGKYEANTDGEIRNVRTYRTIKPSVRHGHPTITLMLDSKPVNWSLARLIWTTFVSDLEDSDRIGHIDGDALNCAVSNLYVRRDNVKLTKEEFLAGMNAAKEAKEEATDRPGSVAAEIEEDLKRERASQTPVKQTVQIPKANSARIETPEKPNPFLNNPLAMPKLSGSVKGPIEDVVDLLHKAGFYGITVTAWFPDHKK